MRWRLGAVVLIEPTHRRTEYRYAGTAPGSVAEGQRVSRAPKGLWWTGTERTEVLFPMKVTAILRPLGAISQEAVCKRSSQRLSYEMD